MLAGDTMTDRTMQDDMRDPMLTSMHEADRAVFEQIDMVGDNQRAVQMMRTLLGTTIYDDADDEWQGAAETVECELEMAGYGDVDGELIVAVQSLVMRMSYRAALVATLAEQERVREQLRGTALRLDRAPRDNRAEPRVCTSEHVEHGRCVMPDGHEERVHMGQTGDCWHDAAPRAFRDKADHERSDYDR
jgi:hypothetical protein